MENFILGQAWALPLAQGRWAEGNFHPGHGELTPLQHGWVRAARRQAGTCWSHSAPLSPGLCSRAATQPVPSLAGFSLD